MPLPVRIILWVAFAIAIIVAAILAVITLAGNSNPDRQRWTLFTGVFIGVLVFQSGYLLGPFVVGRGGWLLWTTVALMIPGVLAFATAVATPIYLTITATRPDGESGWRTIAGIGPMALIALVLYALPPILLIVHRERAPAATLVEALHL